MARFRPSTFPSRPVNRAAGRDHLGRALSKPSQTEEEATAKLIVSIITFSVIILIAIGVSIHRKITQDMHLKVTDYILGENGTSITLEIDAQNDDYLFYSIRHQNENIFIDITPSSLMNSQRLGDTIFITIREGEKNICIRTIGEPYKLYLKKDSETNEWEISDWWDKTSFLFNNPFLF